MSSDFLIFWASVLLLGYTYLFYPVLMFVVGMLRSRPHRRLGTEPIVSIVIVAHNEVKRIDRRLKNLLSLDYPKERLEILVASDGSTDGTVERARGYEQDGVNVIAYETHRGKPGVLNDVVPKARGEIVVLADARQHFKKDALRALVASFADPQVGAVSGDLILTGDSGGIGEGVGFYWRYEKFIRRSESRVDSTVGATGAIYAIRKDLFKPIPEDTILDDVLVPMRITRRGYRVLFEPEARAFDEVITEAEHEFTRKVRTIAGNFQLFSREPWLLNPFRNRLCLQITSHKGLRLLSPLFLVAAFGANLFLLDWPFYRLALVAQVVFYLAALGGYCLGDVGKKIPFLSIPYVLCLLSWATVVAFVRFVTGRQSVTWKKASA